MLTLYKWYIRTTLEYAAPVWHSSLTAEQHMTLERLEKRCLRIILGDAYVTYRHALEVLGIQSLYDRREALTRRFGESLLQSPDHRDFLPPTLEEVHGRQTRNRSKLQNIRCRFERYRKSTIPYIVRMLNS